MHHVNNARWLTLVSHETTILTPALCSVINFLRTTASSLNCMYFCIWKTNSKLIYSQTCR
jgi:hypothetical protein